MITEDLMRKYKYGYVHSCKLLEEPFIKDLLKENQELKKQVDELNRFKFSCKKDETQIPATVYNKKIIEDTSKIKTQQKEFIKYLEDEIQNKREKSTTLTAFIRNVVPLQQCLQKYKEIIGVKDEKDNN